jgi:chromosomal replication initiation ATPase DnaA
VAICDFILDRNEAVETPRETIRAIIAVAAAAERVSIDDVLGASRKRAVVRARHAAMRAVKARYPHRSFPEIGRIFGCHHTTVIYALGAQKRRTGA